MSALLMSAKGDGIADSAMASAHSQGYVCLVCSIASVIYTSQQCARVVHVQRASTLVCQDSPTAGSKYL